jgi:Tfp pilus assembly protein PilF
MQEALDRLESNQDDLEAVLFMAEAKLLKGDIAEAKNMLEMMCHRLQQLSRAFKLLGDICSHDDSDMAQDYYRKYLSMAPDAYDSAEAESRMEPGSVNRGNHDVNAGFQTLTMADLMIKQGHIDSAMEILQEILATDPENRQALDKIAKIKLIRELDSWRKRLVREKLIT